MKLSKCPQFIIQLLVVVLCTSESFAEVVTYRATCSVMVNPVLEAGIKDKVTGIVTFTQVEDGDTRIGIALSGFDTTDAYIEHGFHIHESNDLTDGCDSLGGHYNPLNIDHGAPTATVRHIGDLGNIIEDSRGKVVGTLTDKVISLSGPYSIIGKGLVIHQQRDDLGLGGDEGSLATGNAGARVACCVIKLTSAGGAP